jgi:uncharacterized protein YecE (DUF72 family)
MTIEVGLCGFTIARPTYALRFPVVEVQHTFYQPPPATTLDRWRAAMPPGFEFTIKAWQLVTHTGGSPTYRRLARPLSASERADAGAFRATAIVEEGWRVTLECAARLRATAILFQCPASFRPTPEHLASVRAFFARIHRPPGVHLMLEPRGPAWTSQLGRSLCDEIGAVHVVDPFVTLPVDRASDAIRYFRLHGITGFRHVYSDAELRELARIVRATPDARSYVMFNNIPRVGDAARFMEIVGRN